MGAPTTTSRQPVADLLASQVIVPDWMRQAVAGLGPDAEVEVDRAWALGASYVLAIRLTDGRT